MLFKVNWFLVFVIVFCAVCGEKIVANEDSTKNPDECFSCMIEVNQLDSPMSLAGKWLFTREDRIENANEIVDLSSWVKLETPGPWTLAYDDGRLFEIGWYRGVFQFSEDLIGKKVVFYFDAYMSPLEIFLDGEESWERKGNQSHQKYFAVQPIPFTFKVTKKQHVIALRVDTPLMVGIYQLPFQLRPYTETDYTISLYSVFGGNIRFISAYVILFLGVFFVFLYLRVRSSIYIVAGLTNIGVFPFYAFPNDMLVKFFDPTNLLIGHYPGIMYMALGHMVFSQFFYKKYTRTVVLNYIITGITSCLILSFYFNFNLEMFQAVRKFVFVFSIYMATHFVYNSTRGALSGNRRAMILTLGYWMFWLASVHDILLALGLIRSTSLIFLGTFAASVACLLVTADIFAETFRSNKALLIEVEEANSNLELKIKERTYDLFLTTQNLKTILDNLPQGVLVINHDLSIASEYSKSVLEIFEIESIKSDDFFEFISKRISIDSNEMEQLCAVLESSLGEDIINFDANQDLLPFEWHFVGEGSRKHLRLGWAPILDADDQILRILLTVTDVTHIKQLEEESKLNQTKSEVIASIIDGTYEKSKRFVSNQLTKLEKYSSYNGKFLTQTQIKQVFRDIHSAKGNARLLHFNQLAKIAHETETKLVDISKLEKVRYEKIDSILTEFNGVLISLDKALEEFDPSINSSSPKKEVLRKEQNELLEHIKDSKIAIQNGRELSLGSLIKYRALGEIVSQIEASLNDLTKNADKHKTKLNYLSKVDVFLADDFSQDLNDILLHLVRNSIDHGIETSDERRKKNKPNNGSINIFSFREEDDLVIDFSDDGSGINVEKVLARAQMLGMSVSREIDYKEVLSIIVSPSFSTADHVSEISGRGFGMNIVVSTVERWNGRIEWTNLPTSDEPRSNIPFNIRVRFRFHENFVLFDMQDAVSIKTESEAS